MASGLVSTARVLENGQILLSKEICECAHYDVGDELTAICEADGIKLMNPAHYAMRELQRVMAGEAEKAGLYTEEDIVALCKEVRRECHS